MILNPFFLLLQTEKKYLQYYLFLLSFLPSAMTKNPSCAIGSMRKTNISFFMHSRNIRRCEYVWRFCSLLLLLLDIEWAFRRDMLIKELNTCKCLCIKIGMELRTREEYFSIIENKNTFTYRILWIETHFMHSFVVFCFLFQFFVLLLLWFEY